MTPMKNISCGPSINDSSFKNISEIQFNDANINGDTGAAIEYNIDFLDDSLPGNDQENSN